MYGGPGSRSALDPLRTKRFFLAGLAVGVLAMSATGLAAARLIESPRQLAARSAAPAASVITGVARMRVLRTAIALAGKVRPGRTVSVTASAPYAAVIVTGMPAKLGSRVWPGQVIAEIDGRPVVLLRGRLPPYRNLHEGDVGPDVAQLQAALTRLGYPVYDEQGYFGPSTAFALLLMYSHLGYAVPRYRPQPPKPGQSRPLPTPYLPMREVSYIPAPSALVVAAPAKTGAAVRQGQVVLRLATGNPYVTGLLSAREAAETGPGTSARIVSASPPVAATGVVARISVIPAYAAGGTGQAEYQVVVTSRHRLSQRAIGRTVRLTLLVPVTSGPVLTVPLTAVFSGRDAGHARESAAGSAYVVRMAARGRRHQVAVITGPSAGGLVAIQPVEPGMLRPGDRVLIGVGR